MALFERRPQSDSIPLYSVGLSKTILIVGLGNPGRDYDGSRHNIGFTCLDSFAIKQKFDPWVDKKDMKAQITSQQLGNSRVILMKPSTFMNDSGIAVQAVSHYYKIGLADIAVVYDEYALPFGQIRMRSGGESAGHNGIKSLIQHLAPDFGRIRVGIQAESPMAMTDFVLAKFSPDEQAQMEALTREVNSILSEFAYGAELQAETRSFII